jgi:hypothetical protein
LGIKENNKERKKEKKKSRGNGVLIIKLFIKQLITTSTLYSINT